MLKRLWNYLKNKFTRQEIDVVITPHGQCLLNYITKVQSGEDYENIQLYDAAIDEITQKCGGDRSQALYVMRVLLTHAESNKVKTEQND